MKQHSNFYYHKQCYACSHCTKTTVYRVLSKDGKTLWCELCYVTFSQCCFYCKTVFYSEKKHFVSPSLLGKITCETCFSKVENEKCFTCLTKLQNV